MTTAASFGTPDRCIRYALADAGLLQEGDDPTSEQFANCTNRLNDIINLCQATGLKLWTQNDQSVTLVASQATYTLKPSGSVNITKPMRVLQAFFLDSSNNRRPLVVLSRDEYTRLSKVTQTGEINSYFVDKLATQLSVIFWLTPDATAATGTAHLILQSQITNFTGITDELNFPQEWFMYLRWALADDICTGQPQAIMDRCAMKAGIYKAILEDWDVEDASTSFAPDSRMNQGQGSFK